MLARERYLKLYIMFYTQKKWMIIGPTRKETKVSTRNFEKEFWPRVSTGWPPVDQPWKKSSGGKTPSNQGKETWKVSANANFKNRSQLTAQKTRPICRTEKGPTGGSKKVVPFLDPKSGPQKVKADCRPSLFEDHFSGPKSEPLFWSISVFEIWKKNRKVRRGGIGV